MNATEYEVAVVMATTWWVPQWADQPYWARRVADLGIGAAHGVQAPTTESLTAALAAAPARGIRARAKAVAGTIRTDGATVAAELLLDTVSRARGSRPSRPNAPLSRL
jgi:vancomycin aglycone glucosyltransferase